MKYFIYPKAENRRPVFFKTHFKITLPTPAPGTTTTQEDIYYVAETYKHLLPFNQPIDKYSFKDLIQRTYDTTGNTTEAAKHRHNIQIIETL